MIHARFIVTPKGLDLMVGASSSYCLSDRNSSKEILATAPAFCVKSSWCFLSADTTKWERAKSNSAVQCVKSSMTLPAASTTTLTGLSLGALLRIFLSFSLVSSVMESSKNISQGFGASSSIKTAGTSPPSCTITSRRESLRYSSPKKK